MSLAPRPYQATTVEAAIAYATENIRGRLLVVCPPGGGKTLIAALIMRSLASEQGLRALAWAHRRELVGQMRDHLVECGIPAEMISVVMAGDKRHNPTAPIQVGSVDTLRHRDKPLADVVISDEAHRDASDGRRALRALYPDAFHCGFTATPIRLDGRGLRSEYDEMIVAAQPSELIAEGWLAAPTIYTVPPELLPDLKGVRKVGGDFNEGQLEERSNRRALVGGIVDHWLRRAEGRRTIVFPVSVKHSHAIVARFRAAGVSAEHLDGEASYAERARILAGLKNGSILVVSSCGVLSEGVNIPEVKCAVMARATASLGLFIQQAGRPMRPWEGVAPVILDHAGNTIGQRHGSPVADREWSLDSVRRAPGFGAASLTICQACRAAVPARCQACPVCSAVMNCGMVPSELQGELEEYRMSFLESDTRAEKDRVVSFALRRGLSVEWTKRVILAKFGGADA